MLKTTNYFSTFETENNALKRITTAEGQAVPMGEEGFEYQYFLKDHLGSTRVVLNQNKHIEQQNSYYPFGMLMAGIPSTNNYTSNKYLYNGKELQDDFSLNWYDYGARFYDPQIGRWHVPDPLADKRSWLSPYNYVQNNPLNRDDPEGNLDDDYKVDKQGNISLIQKTNDKFDVLYKYDESGAVQVDKGVLGKQYSQTGTYSKGHSFSYDILKVRGDEKANDLFKFLANNTNVEWSQTMMGVSGDKGLNYLTTSHNKSTEKGVSQMINTQFQFGYTIRGHIHNHPGNTPYPSGLNDGTGDMGFAKSVTNWYNSKYPNRTRTPFFKIYIPKNGKYIKYNKNSIVSDFISIELPDVIIKPK